MLNKMNTDIQQNIKKMKRHKIHINTKVPFQVFYAKVLILGKGW